MLALVPWISCLLHSYLKETQWWMLITKGENSHVWLKHEMNSASINVLALESLRQSFYVTTLLEVATPGQQEWRKGKQEGKHKGLQHQSHYSFTKAQSWLLWHKRHLWKGHRKCATGSWQPLRGNREERHGICPLPSVSCLLLVKHSSGTVTPHTFGLSLGPSKHLPSKPGPPRYGWVQLWQWSSCSCCCDETMEAVSRRGQGRQPVAFGLNLQWPLSKPGKMHKLRLMKCHWLER